MTDFIVGSCPCGGDLVLQVRYKAPTARRNPFDIALRVFVAACAECGQVELGRAA